MRCSAADCSTIPADFSLPINQLTAAVPLIIGIADFTWSIGGVTFTGIALGSVAAILIHQGMRLLGRSGGAALG